MIFYRFSIRDAEARVRVGMLESIGVSNFPKVPKAMWQQDTPGSVVLKKYPVNSPPSVKHGKVEKDTTPILLKKLLPKGLS